MRVGFIGLGVMGRSMALNLLRGRHELTVYARRPASLAPLVERGAATAETPAALAQALGIDSEGLAHTLDTYNASCRPEDGFTPLALDGLGTDGLVPRKSNWARPVDRPPYRAWPIIAANCFTFGGLKISPSAQVLNTDGETIPGLYAAGETAGLYYRTYTGSTSVMRGAVFGRIAGLDAAARKSRP